MPSNKNKFQHLIEIITSLTNAAITILKFIALFVVLLIAIGIFASLAPQKLGSGNIAIIPIHGIISSGSGGFEESTNSQTTVDLIENAAQDTHIVALFFDIDSPGGTPVASDEIARAIKAANKTSVALIHETGASGAYWIASATNHIIANPMSITGSIGVQASHLEFAGLISDYNITYRLLTAGKYKDIGSRFREMTPEEQKIYQTLLDKLHNQFIATVAQNRGLSEEKVRELASGVVYLGSDAQKIGLVDELGGKKEALAYLEHTLNITADPIDFSTPPTFFEHLAGLSSQSFYQIGRGIGSTISSETKISLT